MQFHIPPVSAVQRVSPGAMKRCVSVITIFTYLVLDTVGLSIRGEIDEETSQRCFASGAGVEAEALGYAGAGLQVTNVYRISYVRAVIHG